jgi:hypothetical protein
MEAPGMGRGLYRYGAFVMVIYEGIESVPISRALYKQRGYDPPFDALPTKKQYDARNP